MAQGVAVDLNSGEPFQTVIQAVDLLCHAIADLVVQLEIAWHWTSPGERLKRLASLIGVAIGRFVKIHPFLNGNGRISRVIWRALLHRYGLRPQAGIVRRPGPPYEDVMRRATVGDYAPAVAVVLRGIAAGPAPDRPVR